MVIGYGHVIDADGVRADSHKIRQIRDRAVWKIVKERIGSAQQKQKTAYDRRHRDVQYKIRDLVWIYKPSRKRGMTDKLVHKNRGPYQVVDRYKEVNYIVEKVKGNKKREIHHVSKLTPCYTRDILESSSESGENRQSDEESSGATDIYYRTTSEGLNNKSTPLEEHSSSSEPKREISQVNQNTTAATNDIPLAPPSRPIRSTRGIPPARYSHSFLIMIMMFLMVGDSKASFHKVSPILWRNTGKPVLKGVTPVNMAVKFNF